MTARRANSSSRSRARRRGRTRCRRGSVRRLRRRRRDGFIHLVERAISLRERSPSTSEDKHDLVLIELDAHALGAALRWEPSRGGDFFPHLYADLPTAAARAACTRLRSDADGVPIAARRKLRHAEKAVRSRTALPGAAAARGGARGRRSSRWSWAFFPLHPQPDHPSLAVALRRPRAAQPGRHRRRLRQGRARARRRARPRLRLCRDRHGDAAAAARQSEPARLPAAARPALSSIGSASTTAATRRRSRGCSGASRPRRRRRQHRRQQGQRRTASPTTCTGSRRSTTSRATSRSTSPRPTRRACATCRRRPRSTSCSARLMQARAKRSQPGKPQAADRRQARARHRRGGSAGAIVSSSSRTRVDGIAVSNTTLSRRGLTRCRRRARPAACPGGRCSTARR